EGREANSRGCRPGVHADVDCRSDPGDHRLDRNRSLWTLSFDQLGILFLARICSDDSWAIGGSSESHGRNQPGVRSVGATATLQRHGEPSISIARISRVANLARGINGLLARPIQARIA